MTFSLFYFPLQAPHVFHSASMYSEHRFGDLEMVSSQKSEESEEKSPQLHPKALSAVLQQSGSQCPDLRMVGDTRPGWARVGLPRVRLPAS